MITYQTDTGRLKRVLVKSAGAAFQSQSVLNSSWEEFGYRRTPDYARSCVEAGEFAKLLESCGAEVVSVPEDDKTGIDSIYVRDAMVMTDAGAVLCRMGKNLRAEEPAVLEKILRSLKIPVVGQIESPGKLEGGDVTWLDSETVAVGLGYRTNTAGIAQFSDLLPRNVKVRIVPLPHYNGPEDVFHLMSILSPIDQDLAVVYSRLLPVVFREELLDRGFELVEVPDDEFESMGTNVLALGPREVVVVNGNPKTRALLARAGCTVHVYSGREISHPGGGGPTCLTRPLERLFGSDGG